MNAQELRKTIEPKSDQLNFDDMLDCTKDIKVTGVRITGSADQPVTIDYDADDGRPYKPCKSMRRVLISAWGDRGAEWVGRSMRLYGDPDVKFGGANVGGIRISHLTDIETKKTYMLTTTRSRRAGFSVEPMKAQELPPLAADVFEEKISKIAALILDGKTTPEQAITNLQKHYGQPTKEQRAEIRGLIDTEKDESE